jgi:hypothetical protein
VAYAWYFLRTGILGPNFEIFAYISRDLYGMNRLSRDRRFLRCQKYCIAELKLDKQKYGQDAGAAAYATDGLGADCSVSRGESSFLRMSFHPIPHDKKTTRAAEPAAT